MGARLPPGGLLPPGCDSPHGCGSAIPQLWQELVVCGSIVVCVHVGIMNYLLGLDFECWNIDSHCACMVQGLYR